MPSPDSRSRDLRIPELWRTTTFRLTSLYGLVFAVGVVLLLGLVYWRTASALTGRVDAIVRSEASTLARSDAADLPAAVRRQGASAAGRLNAYGLFSREGVPVAGTVSRLPVALVVDGPIREIGRGDGFAFRVRALALRLPWGEVLVVGRDVSQIGEVRRITLDALVWSGALIAGLGLAGAIVLSLGPLRRLQALQVASHRIVAGELHVRMPIAGRRDELDLFAGMVNGMIEEVERLLHEAKSANDAVAHDLRTPLAHVRGLLAHVRDGQAADPRAEVDRAIIELDHTLERFRALLRISEIEAQARRANFRPLALDTLLRHVVELYEPLAEARDVVLELAVMEAAPVEGDEKLVFEAVSNLVDNAIKFSPEGGRVAVTLDRVEGAAAVRVCDHGPGISPDEREAVLQRFRRGASAGTTAGSGLGLSIVSAIARLHRFELRLDSNSPGLCAVLVCPLPNAQDG